MTSLHAHLSRRTALLAATAVVGFSSSRALAFTAAPQGYQLVRDRLDGYSFLIPESWTPLSSSGNDVFYRNPYNTDENLFVSISSPSSSKYSSVDNLKSPETAAERTKQQYLSELLSTRLGVRRTTDVVSAQERTASDNRKYYDLELEAKSYASRNQLAVSQKQIEAAMELEWDRRYITVLGVANKRLYEFRLQTASDTYDTAKDTLLFMAQSFRCYDVEV